METREIPRSEWRSFFDIFSRQHEGLLATLEIFGQEGDAQQEPRQIPLKGITLTSVVGESEAIALNLGKTTVDGSEYSAAAIKEVAKRPWPPRSIVRVLSVVEPITPPAAELWYDGRGQSRKSYARNAKTLDRIKKDDCHEIAPERTQDRGRLARRPSSNGNC